MNKRQITSRLLTLPLALLLAVPLAPAQQRRRAAPPAPAPRQEATPARTPRPERERIVEETLSSESYAVHVEVRSVGWLMREQAALGDVEAFRGLADFPAGYGHILDFFKTHEELLEETSLTLSVMPVRAGLPDTLVTLHLPTVESARRFEPSLLDFVSKGWNAFFALGATQAGAAGPKGGAGRAPGKRRQTKAAFPFNIKRAGNLFLVSEAPVTLRSLRGERGSATLADNTRFQELRSRFASEPVFVFADVSLINKGVALQREKFEREMEQRERERERSAPVPTVNMETAPTVAGVAEPAVSQPPASDAEVMAGPDEETQAVPTPLAVDVESAQGRTTAEAENQEGTRESSEKRDDLVVDDGVGGGPSPGFLLSSLLRSGLGALPRWPEAVGAAFALEDNSLVIRALIVNPPDVPQSVVPFLPAIASGPALTLEAPTLLPADSEIVAGVSLDWERIYDMLLGAATAQSAASAEAEGDPGEGRAEGNGEGEGQAEPPRSSIAAVEKLLGFKIKDDLLPALGNEVAVSVPFEFFRGAVKYNKKPPPGASEARPGPVLILSLRNPETLRNVMPKLLVVLGLRSLNEQAVPEKRAGYEINSYGGFAYAFVNNYLVVGENAAPVRYVLDGYAAQQTLAADARYRAATGWQPPQKLAQVYVSDTLMKTLLEEAKQLGEQSPDEEYRALAARLNVPPEGITYGATSEPGGVLHELHFPSGIFQAFSVMQLVSTKQGPIRGHETTALVLLTEVRQAEDSFKKGKGQGRYGTLEELRGANLIPKYLLNDEAYRLEILASGDGYQATATPLEHGKTGRRSFYLDESGLIRGADHQGQRATSSDPPVD